MTTINIPIAAGGDDGVSGSGSGFSSGGSSITLGGYFGTANGWFRFANVTIPQGSTITAATMTAEKTTTAAGQADVIFYANKVANASNPSSGGDYDAKALTTASVTHSNLTGSTGTYTSPSLVSIIQEIVNQGSWASGNALMLLVKDNNSNSTHGGFENRITLKAYEGGGGTYATLNVTYSPAPVLLTASPGSFSLTGVASVAATKQTASVGSFTLTGIAALSSVKQVAAAASFSMTGVSTLSRIACLSSTGSFSLTGISAGVSSISTPAGTGSFSMTGIGASSSIAMACSTGSFGLTGYDITEALGASSGPFTLSGIDALPRLHASIKAESAIQASYTYTCVMATGGDVVFSVAGFGFGNLTGTVSWDGADGAALGAAIQSAINTKLSSLGSAFTSSVSVTNASSTAQGVITFSPQGPVELYIWSQTPNSTGSMTFDSSVAGAYGYAVSGQSAALSYLASTTADTGPFALTGNAATLSYTQVLASETGAFALTGTAATTSTTMLAGTGQLALEGNESLKYDTEIQLDTIVVRYPAKILSHQISIGTEVPLSVLSVSPPKRMTLDAYFPVETAAAYVENSKHRTIMGSGDGVFKLNPTGRTTKAGVLHLERVKPNVVTRTAPFTLMVNVPYIPAGGFRYVAPGNYLTITNADAIELTLVADDSGNNYISTAPIINDPPVLVSDFYQ